MLYAVIGLIVGAAIFFPLGIYYRKTVSEKEISSAEEEGKRIINEATALFTGGELSDEDKELVFRAISEVFWETRSK